MRRPFKLPISRISRIGTGVQRDIRRGITTQTERQTTTTSISARLRTAGYKVVKFCGLTTVTVGVLVGGFFVYDAMTYRDSSSAPVSVSSLALTPTRGGPKNLPIASELIGDHENAKSKALSGKPKLVVLGSGWGAVSLIQKLNPEDYHVLLVSPSNYFVFTPLLPSATVGTVELQSIVEPIRKLAARVRAQYVTASAESVDFEDRLVEIKDVDADGNPRHFYLPYDKLVVAVGATQRTFGVEGLEYCHFLKTAPDAIRIRKTVLDNFERAVLPTTGEEERKRLLSFVVCGGGPTGVEFAAELYDMINEDLCDFFPRLLRSQVSVHIVQSGAHILNTYDRTISEFAERKFEHDAVDVLTNARVQRVERDRVIFTQQGPSGETITKQLPFGLCLWSTGIARQPITRQICDAIPDQANEFAIETDSHLRVIGAPLGEVYAIGDCATVRHNMAEHVMEFIVDDDGVAGTINPRDGQPEVSYAAFVRAAKRAAEKYPQASTHLRKVDALFRQADTDHSNTLNMAELRAAFASVDAKLTSLPATAQRAHQQGTYLANKFNVLSRAQAVLEANNVPLGDGGGIDAMCYKPFRYNHLGSLAYLGNSAVGDLPGGYSFTGGLMAMYMWRSVYWSEQVSFRTRALIAVDWFKRAIWGRDLCRF